MLLLDELKIDGRVVRRYCDEMKVFLACGHRLGLADISHTTNTRISGLRVGRDTEGGLALTLIEGLKKSVCVCVCACVCERGEE